MIFKYLLKALWRNPVIQMSYCCVVVFCYIHYIEFISLNCFSQLDENRSLSVALSEDLVKPLKVSVESQHRVRKAVEAGVDKTGRVLAEWRSAQAKAKKHCYLSARDNEKMQDQVFINKPRTLTDKETAKLEAKCKKTQEAVRKVWNSILAQY